MSEPRHRFRETVSYSVIHGDDRSTMRGHLLPPPIVSHPYTATLQPGSMEDSRPPSIVTSESQQDPEAQLNKNSSEDLNAVMEALDDRLVQLQGVVDLADSDLGSLHGQVTMGKTRMAAAEHEVIASEQRMREPAIAWIFLQLSPS
ncbi:hypothetical protein L1987_53140 [Smallanthus sonchifolius]|uniref:Uncharacterized protein n=1 Tax=Smallanthus sonchifolius TaxID=185202 RepID=A0ACB9EUJ9_9ASTR|nr:hypothetical protein L1987_53140 [Smallanthus sonchifolius]